jgi:hypothetical protein
MVVKVLSRIGQALAHPFDGLSLAEGSMLLRLRRASIALLCLVGAVGLSLVVFISQLGWPDVLSGPLPGGPAKVGKIHDAVALHSPSAASGGTAAGSLGGVTPGRVAKSGKKQASGSLTSSHLGRSHGLSSAPVATPGPSGLVPSSPTSTPAAPSEPAPVVSAPASSSPTTAVESEQSSSGAVKASNDSARAAGLAGSKSPGRQSTGGKDPSTSKTNEQASAKARRDESVAAPPASSSPAPAGTSPAAAKEADDAAKAGHGGH